jgi:hypothetical protein
MPNFDLYLEAAQRSGEIAFLGTHRPRVLAGNQNWETDPTGCEACGTNHPINVYEFTSHYLRFYDCNKPNKPRRLVTEDGRVFTPNEFIDWHPLGRQGQPCVPALSTQRTWLLGLAVVALALIVLVALLIHVRSGQGAEGMWSAVEAIATVITAITSLVGIFMLRYRSPN